jgi:hypothetical protein
MSAVRGREEGPARRVAEAKLRRKGPSGVGVAAAAAVRGVGAWWGFGGGGGGGGGGPAAGGGVGMGPVAWRRLERRRLLEGMRREKAMGSDPVGLVPEGERPGRGGRLPVGLLRAAWRTPALAVPSLDSWIFKAT